MNNQSQSGSRQLASWKEIADYLRRSVRTVHRWEESEQLPVHRQQHDRGASVYAYPNELDAWLQERSDRTTQASELVEVAMTKEACPLIDERSSGAESVGPRMRPWLAIAILVTVMSCWAIWTLRHSHFEIRISDTKQDGVPSSGNPK